ncbi:NUDIX domain-containing protein [Streptomyces sp. bgisy027]|uniref:NUDIX domain-containing protein n=1 Tax=Streptomyces sp. bgisy027 TaxID=3413770 RepID=UPI003D72556C
MTDDLKGRAPFQVLVLPFRQTGDGLRYALFRRADRGCWQGVAGGGGAGESPMKAARREAAEEAGLDGDLEFVELDSRATIPAVYVTGEFTWGPDVLVIPEFAFGVRVDSPELLLSNEHTEYRWLAFDAAMTAVQWDSNRSALWELDHRLRRAGRDGLTARS